MLNNPLVTYLKPNVEFYKVYNSYVNNPQNSELDSQILNYVGAYHVSSFFYKSIKIDKEIEQNNENYNCPICFKKFKCDDFCI